MQKNYQGKKLWEKLFFSPTLCQKSATKKIAYIAVLTAVLTVGNTLLEIKFFDRLKALERLSELSTDEGNDGMMSFYQAIEKSACGDSE